MWFKQAEGLMDLRNITNPTYRLVLVKCALSNAQQEAVVAWLSVPTASPMSKTIPVILDLFQVVLNPGKELPQTSCEVAHFLSTSGPPIASVFRRLDTEKLAPPQSHHRP